MKKYLLSKEGKFYKANLHCHSTLSDGWKTPEELKEIYMRHGYSIIAYTDHNVLIPHPELNDENFLALNGVEIDFTEEIDAEFDQKRCCHLCMIALDENNLIQPCWHRQKYLFGNAPKYKDLVQHDDTLPDFERHYNAESINTAIKTAREKGFFVTYNHPVWSRESYPEYSQYRGMNAMEIINYCSIVEGHFDYNGNVYDDMLKTAGPIYCIATDDNHDQFGEDTPHFDSCGGFTMIKAKELSYSAIADSLQKGNFYSSEGPEIYELIYEDGMVSIKCSPVQTIIMSTDNRHKGVALGEKIGDTVTEATFPLKSLDKYFRITIIDEHGKHADTNAYFIEDLK